MKNAKDDEDDAFWHSLLEDAREEDETHAGVALAGGLAGVVAETLMHPFDTLSHRAKVHPEYAYGTLFGAWRQIVREEGVRALWCGWSVTALVSGPSTAVYFAVYHAMRSMALPMARSRTEENLVFFLAGAVAEFHSTALFVPFDVVRSRLQLGSNPNRATGGFMSRDKPYHSIRGAMIDIVRAEGWRGLFAGAGTVVLQDCVYSALQFVFYENIRGYFLHTYPTYSNTHALAIGALSGGIAGGISAILTNPLDTISSRLQTQGRNRKFGHSAIAVFRSCIAKEGWNSLWRGSVSKAVASIPMAAIQFGVFEAARQHLFHKN